MIPPFHPADAEPAVLPHDVVLNGRTVRIERLAARHFDGLYRSLHGPEREDLWLYLAAGPFASRGAFQAWVEANAAGGSFPFVLLDPPSGAALGMASLMRVDISHRVVEIGNVVFSAALQRTIAATEAHFLLTRHIFEDLNFRRYEWKCDDHNAKSKRAAQRLGFAFEGVFHQHMIVKGRNRDTAWFSMLDGEWPARKAAFENWLDPANFDAAGMQKRPLAACGALGVDAAAV